jgi:preprotein translocase subunit SecA
MQLLMVDSVLIDDAGTPLISGPVPQGDSTGI